MKWKPAELNSIDFKVGEPHENVIMQGDQVYPLKTVDDKIFDFLLAEKGQ
jgi:hypothetical protein